MTSTNPPAVALISSRTQPWVWQWLRRRNRWRWLVAAALLVAASIAIGLWLIVLPPMLMLVALAAASLASFELGMRNLLIEVWDAGNHLRVQRHGVDERIPLAQLREIRYRGRYNPPRASVYLRRPCRWGSELTYLPDLSAGRDHARRAIEQLNRRIAAAQHSDTGVSN